ncbi:MAG: oligosaccharide flippase family protein [Crocinitomicaceae bacterium]|nr:oligosaccharide flippase family protein [Crocinitomicaceae bacterium]MDG1657555.1 oligosaccharide flippase family protein [Crocinitomicaceae bacterium]
MQRKFLSGLVLMLVLNLLIKPLAIFGIDAEIQNRVGAESYGIYFSLLSFSFLFNILMDFGINNFTTKRVAQQPEVATSYLGRMLVFRFILFIFYAIVSYTIALILGWDSYELYLLSFLVFNQFLVTLIAYARSHFSGLLLFKTEAFISILDRFLLILICGALIYMPITGHTFQIEWFIWIQTLCYGITVIVAAILLLKKIGKPKLAFRPTFSYAVIRKSVPYALLILLMMIYTRVDSVMIERLHWDGKAQAGYYAQGFRLFDALFMFAMIFSGLLYPLLSKMLAANESIKILLGSATKLLIGGTIALTIIACFNSELILGWIYDNNIYESEKAFRMLMVGFVGMSVNLIFGTLLTADGSLKFLNILSAIGILVNIAMNAYLIPKYGANGAAFATLITQCSVSLTQVVYCVYRYSLIPSLIQIVQFVGYTVSVFLLCYFIEVETVWMFLAICASAFFGLIIFRLIDMKQLKLIFSKVPE